MLDINNSQSMATKADRPKSQLIDDGPRRPSNNFSMRQALRTARPRKDGENSVNDNDSDSRLEREIETLQKQVRNRTNIIYRQNVEKQNLAKSKLC